MSSRPAAGRRSGPRAAIVRTRAKEFQHDSAGVELGYRYDQSPICVPDGTPPPLDHATYLPGTWPGARAPHAWLADGRSTLDLFGRGFVLLALGPDGPDPSVLAEAAEKAGVPLTVVTLDSPEARMVYERRLVLVRPDGHVVWRGDSGPRDARGIIEQVRGGNGHA